MEQYKQTIAAVLSRCRRFFSSRVFAAVVLGAATVGLAVTVSIHSRAVTVTDGTQSRVVLTMHNDPYKVLSTAGITLNQHDAIHVGKRTESIDVQRAMTVQVQADGISTVLHMTEGTVATALRRADITVNAQDTVSHDLSAPVSDGLCVSVNRVAYKEYTVTETIPYSTNTKYTAVLRPGVTKVIQSGSNGTRTITYRQTIVDGRLSETIKVGETVTKKATTKQVLKVSAYGTPLSKAPFNIQLNAKNQPVKYKKKFSGSCTAYSIGSRGASGMKLGVGTVAVNPKKIPYGTKLWITSADGKFVYGYAIAADTGSFAKGNRTIADLYMGSYDECCYFGRRDLNIYVLE